MSAAYKIALAAGGLLLLVVVASLMFNNPQPAGEGQDADALLALDAPTADPASAQGVEPPTRSSEPTAFGVDIDPLGPPVRDGTQSTPTVEAPAQAPPTRVAYAAEPPVQIPVEPEPSASLTVGRPAFPDHDPFSRSPFLEPIDEPTTPPEPRPLDEGQTEALTLTIEPATPTSAEANVGIALSPVDPVTRNAPGSETGASPLPPPEPPVLRLYTVESGDTLSSIALTTYGSASNWVDIAQANPLIDPNRLKLGQELKLPNLDAAPSRGAGDNADSTDTGDDLPRRGATYVVKSGDNLIKIAKQFYNSSAKWELIYQANRQKIGDDPGNLKLGMELLIPPPDNGAN